MASTMRFDTWENPTGTLSLNITAAIPGLTPIKPSTIDVGSGSATMSNTGLITFTSVSSVSLNDVFSSTYSTYKVIYNAANGTAGTNFGMRLRVSGSDLTTSGYQSVTMRSRSDNSTVINSFASADLITIGGGSTSSADLAGEVTITNPFASLRTYVNGQHSIRESDALLYIHTDGSHTRNTTSYTGLTFFPVGGVFTGTMQVYGYR